MTGEPEPGRTAVPWAAGEVVRLVVDVGDALGRVHARGDAHGGLGGVGAWTVALDGRALLGPVPSDARSSAADDVRMLARRALTLLGRLPQECTALPAAVEVPDVAAWSAPEPDDAPGLTARRRDAGSTGERLLPVVPGCVDGDVPRERLRHVLLLADREDAPPIGLLVAQALAVADPVPLRPRDPGVLARDALVRSAASLPGGPGPRHRRRGPARGALVPAACGTVVLGLGLAALGALGPLTPDLLSGPSSGVAGPPSRATVPSADGAGHGPLGGTVAGEGPRSGLADGEAGPRTQDPAPYREPGPGARLEAEVVVLTRARAAALAEGDLLRLLSVTVPGSPAALADLTRFAGLHAGAGAEDPGSTSRVPGDSQARPLEVRVEHVAALPADPQGHRVLLVAAVGQEGGTTATPARGVVLSLTADAGTWRVREVAAAPAGATGGEGADQPSDG